MAKDILSMGGSTDLGSTPKVECYFFDPSTDLWSAATSLGTATFWGAGYPTAAGIAQHSGGKTTVVIAAAYRNVVSANVWSARTAIPSARVGHYGASDLLGGTIAVMLGGSATGVVADNSIKHSMTPDTYTAGPAPGTAGMQMTCQGSLTGSYIYFNSYMNINKDTDRYNIAGNVFSDRTDSNIVHNVINGGWRTSGFIHSSGSTSGTTTSNERHSESGNTWSNRTALTAGVSFAGNAPQGDSDGGLAWGSASNNSQITQDTANTTSVGPAYATNINYQAGAGLVNDTGAVPVLEITAAIMLDVDEADPGDPQDVKITYNFNPT